MSENISGVGLKIIVSSTRVGGVPFPLTKFADDVDPFDIPEITIAEAKMGLNGDLITYSVATPITIKIGLIPDTAEDEAMQLLFTANRIARGTRIARDQFKIVGVYGSGRTITLNDGVLTAGQPGTGVASEGRLKSKVYTFMFADTFSIANIFNLGR